MKSLCLQHPSQPIVHALAIFASNGSFLCFSWKSFALSSQYVSLVKASGGLSHEHSSFSIEAFRFSHMDLHQESQHSVQVPDLQYMISYFFFSRSLHSSPRALMPGRSAQRQIVARANFIITAGISLAMALCC